MGENHTSSQPALEQEYAQQKLTMIEQQIRPAGVLDEHVLSAMLRVKREQFVPSEFAALAYSDTRIPLPCDQEMLSPVMVGQMLQALEIKPRHRILEIGTGSGYLSACLSLLGHSVHTVEYHEPLHLQAQIHLKDYRNIELHHADALKTKLPMSDIVVVTASCEEIPQAFLNVTNPEGRLLMVIGKNDDPIQRATLVNLCQDHPLPLEIFDAWLPTLIRS